MAESRRLEGVNLVLVIVTTVATIIGAIAAVIALRPHPDPAGAPAQSPATVSTGAAPVTSTGSGGTATSDYLARLTPSVGGTHLTELPEALQGKAEYADSVAIACPTNEGGQKQAEVSYESRGLYRTFTATLEAYRTPTAGVRMQLFVFLDPATRDFGIDNEKPGGGQIQLTAGQSSPFSSTVKDAYFVRLRLVCEKPGGMLILRQAALAPHL